MKQENNAKVFWQHVKDLIKEKNLTQETLAKNADVSFVNLKQQIYHDRYPMAHEAVRIAKALDTTVEYLVFGNIEDNAEVIHTYSKIPEDRKQLALEILNILTK